MITFTQEWKIAKELLSLKFTKRSGVSYFNHVEEGVRILKALDAPFCARRAFCLHPLTQGDEDLQWFLDSPLINDCDPRSVALALEYRWVANNSTRDMWSRNQEKVVISKIPVINLMLAADKIQNRKDFEIYHQNHPNKDALARYFRTWLWCLDVDEERYQAIVRGLQGEAA